MVVDKKDPIKASKEVKKIIGDEITDIAEKVLEKVQIKEKKDILPGGSSSEINPFKEDDLSKLPEEVKKEVDKKDEIPSHLIQTKDEYSVEVIKDFDGKVDPFFIEKKDPNYAYRFLSATDKNLSIKTGNLLYQKGGWQIVPRDHLLNVLKLDKRFINKEGVYRVGDTILARMPKKLHEEKAAYKKKMTDEKTNRIKRVMEEGDPSMAGVGNENMKGFQTQDKLKM